MLEVFEGGAGLIVKLERGVIVSKMGERNDNVGVVVDEPAVEISEAKERLNVLDLSWLWPVLDCFDFVGCHGESFR